MNGKGKGQSSKREKRARREGESFPRVGVELDVEVERILPGGLGLAHAQGGTLLVALSAPGDKARVRVRQLKGRVAFASIEKLHSHGEARTEPPCPYFGRCGGCDFQQLTYEAQLAAKVEIVRDCLRRVARTEPPEEIPITPSPSAWRYRSRAQWQHDPVKRQLGYFERGTHAVCDVSECPVAAPALQDKLASLRARLREGELPEDAREFEAAAGDDGVSLAPPLSSEDLGERTRRIGEELYRFDAECFFQINHSLLEDLVREAVGDASGETAFDLFCGVGLFTLPLARRFQRVLAVEGNPQAARYARVNLSEAGLRNARVETAQVGEWMTKRAGNASEVDLLLLDPPRAGAEPETVRAILRLKPRRVSYVSCDPATLSRDLRTLLEGGYSLLSVRAFDMFPQTHHVETVAHLRL